MKRRPEIYLKHMLLAIERIEEYIEGHDEGSFKGDNKTSDAVIRQLEIIGEAARHVPSEMTVTSPVEWEKITGMRHRLIHDYLGVDLDIVWKTATKGIKSLKRWLLKKSAQG